MLRFFYTKLVFGWWWIKPFWSGTAYLTIVEIYQTPFKTKTFSVKLCSGDSEVGEIRYPGTTGGAIMAEYDVKFTGKHIPICVPPQVVSFHNFSWFGKKHSNNIQSRRSKPQKLQKFKKTWSYILVYEKV